MVPTAALVLLVATFQAPADATLVPPDTRISLQRSACYGSCPVYTVTIDSRGTVTFVGERSVRAVGRQTGRIPAEDVARLLARADDIHFFDLKDAYRFIKKPDGSTITVTDLPTQTIVITSNGRTKRVEDYVGAPAALREFEDDIDRTAGTRKWVFIDEPTLRELLQSGWRASTDEGAALLREALARDDVAVAQLLIDAGADLNGPADNRLPPLLFARSRPMVDLLVAAGADPNERPVGRAAARTPLMMTDYKEPDVARALLEAGANLEDQDDGRTALWYAACAGNWKVVSVLLAAGADPRGSTAMSARDCTKQARQDAAHMPPPIVGTRRTVADFDRVIALLARAGAKVRKH